jgi:FkbM family methyltransferase
MNSLFFRAKNKANRIFGSVACRLFAEYRKNPGWIVQNSFLVNGYRADINFRAHDHGDWGAVHQVFHCQDYRVDLWPQGRALYQYYEEITQQGRPLIIDAGAHIGSGSVYFASTYPSSTVIAIEPERQNCDLLRINAKNPRIHIREAAIGKQPGKLFLQDPGTASWGFRIGETGKYAVDVVTVPDLLADEGKDRVPFIIKIDIEGSEINLFDDDCKWLNEFAMVVIELHDWMLPGTGSSNNFFRRLSKLNFDILHRGENLFCFNNEKIAKFYGNKSQA